MNKIAAALALSMALFVGFSCAERQRVPLAEIDRAIVDPKGTWSTKPGIGFSVISEDTTSYRSFSLNNLLVASYAINDNLSLPIIPYPYIIWQITKSPYADPGMRDKWQFALGAGLPNLGGRPDEYRIAGELLFIWKKRISSSIWYSGQVRGSLFYQHPMRWFSESGMLSNTVGFQLSQKADVVTGFACGYGFFAAKKERMAFGEIPFGFHYNFSQYYSIYGGTNITANGKSTGIGVYIGNEFYW